MSTKSLWKVEWPMKYLKVPHNEQQTPGGSVVEDKRALDLVESVGVGDLLARLAWALGEVVTHEWQHGQPGLAGHPFCLLVHICCVCTLWHDCTARAGWASLASTIARGGN